MDFINILNYAFIQKAYFAGSFVAIVCAILGLFLVLRKLSLIGDGLSHVSFGAIALGLFFGFYSYYIVIPIVLVASYFILKLTQKAKIYGDAAIGIISSLGIAGGIMLAGVSKGFNVDLFGYLFGNILAVSNQEMYLSVGLSVAVLLIIILLYNELFAVTFDEEYAKISGVKVEQLNVILTSLTAIAVVLAVKIVGVMLVSSLLILPAVTALQITKSFKSAIFVSVAAAVIPVLTGITVSFYADLPAGATIVLVSLALFSFSLVYRKVS
jgi:zinc transport system permease protein